MDDLCDGKLLTVSALVSTGSPFDDSLGDASGFFDDLIIALAMSLADDRSSSDS